MWYVDQIGKPILRHNRLVVLCKFVKCIYLGSEEKAEDSRRDTDKSYYLRVDTLADTFDDVVHLVKKQLKRFKKDHEDSMIRSEYALTYYLQEVASSKKNIQYNNNHIEKITNILGEEK